MRSRAAAILSDEGNKTIPQEDSNVWKRTKTALNTSRTRAVKVKTQEDYTATD